MDMLQLTSCMPVSCKAVNQCLIQPVPKLSGTGIAFYPDVINSIIWKDGGTNLDLPAGEKKYGAA